MFIREKTVQGRTYLQEVENYREGAKVRQRIIATLGRKEELIASGQINGVLRSLSRFSDKVKMTEDFQEEKLEAKRVHEIGPDLICGRLWRELGIEEVLKKLLCERKFEFHLERAVYLSALSSLYFPSSDRRTMAKALHYRITGAEEISPHHPYRAMAWQEETWKTWRRNSSFKTATCSPLSMVFLDTTSLYFEGMGE